ncbi:hypothetical protein RDI58_022467 [Solanum bulbocastanum]|uniref:Uncharacterized protein n=1 Tax=Solanum bulbocastanum TaxID=147425 RepID=A0AAN8Y839_SOLBU
MNCHKYKMQVSKKYVTDTFPATTCYFTVYSKRSLILFPWMMDWNLRDLLKQKSADYARAKDLAIKEASDIVDVESIKHIAENQTLIGDVVGKTADDWKVQKELFYQKTGILHRPVKDSVDVVGEEHDNSQQEGAEEHDKSQQEVAEEQDKSQQEVAEEQDDNEDLSKELEEVLLSSQNESDFEE